MTVLKKETYKGYKIHRVPIGRGFWVAQSYDEGTGYTEVARSATKKGLKLMLENL